MSIPPPNYTQTPNIFFDEIMRTLNEGELRVLLIIIRQTFGWHKLEDWITLQLLAEKTGYDRRSICRILDRLIEKKLIFKRMEGTAGMQKCFYGLVIDGSEKEVPKHDDGVETEEEMALFKKSYTSDRRVTPPPIKKSYTSDRRVTRPVTGGSPTKETYTKEKEQQQANAVVVFDKSKEKEQSKAKIYECLKAVDIPEADKYEICSKYENLIVENALAFTVANKDKIKSSFVAYLKMACSKGLKIENKPIPLTPIEKMMKLFKNGGLYNQAECFLSAECIAFQRGLKHESVTINQFFKWDHLVSLCNSFGIKIPDME
jgi:phage replication O-like protein O